MFGPIIEGSSAPWRTGAGSASLPIRRLDAPREGGGARVRASGMDYTALGMRDRVGVNQQCQPRWITERLRPRRNPVKVLAAYLSITSLLS